jgi:hypothetical protein
MVLNNQRHLLIQIYLVTPVNEGILAPELNALRTGAGSRVVACLRCRINLENGGGVMISIVAECKQGTTTTHPLENCKGQPARGAIKLEFTTRTLRGALVNYTGNITTIISQRFKNPLTTLEEQRYTFLAGGYERFLAFRILLAK